MVAGLVAGLVVVGMAGLVVDQAAMVPAATGDNGEATNGESDQK